MQCARRRSGMKSQDASWPRANDLLLLKQAQQAATTPLMTKRQFIGHIHEEEVTSKALTSMATLEGLATAARSLSSAAAPFTALTEN